MVKNKFGYEVEQEKQERRHTPSGDYRTGLDFSKKFNCNYCGEEMYQYDETRQEYWMACHGWVYANGVKVPCPNNLDYNGKAVNKTWRPAALDALATREMYFYGSQKNPILKQRIPDGALHI